MATLKLTRDTSFCGIAMPYRILMDGVEVGRISVGKSLDLPMPARTFRLDIEMVGKSLTFHPVKTFVMIDPLKAESGIVKAHITTSPRWIHALTNGIWGPVGKAQVKVLYI